MIGALVMALVLQMGAPRSVSPIRACTSGEPSVIPATSVVVDPRDADRAFVAADTVYRTTGRGDCLAASDEGIDHAPFPCIRPVEPAGLSIDPQDPETLYLGAGQGVFKSTDGGRTWEPRNHGIPFVICEADVFPVAADPTRSNVVYAGSAYGVFKTVDRGDSWALSSNFGVAAPGESGFAFDPRDTDVVYVASYRLFKTTSGGQLWTPMDQGLPSGRVTAVAVDWSNPDVVYAGTADGFFRSADAAENWQASGLSAHTIYSVQQDPVNATTLFAGTDAGAFWSGDGGESWSLLTGELQDVAVFGIATAPSDPSTVYAATAVGVFRSRDGGASWTPL